MTALVDLLVLFWERAPQLQSVFFSSLSAPRGVSLSFSLAGVPSRVFVRLLVYQDLSAERGQRRVSSSGGVHHSTNPEQTRYTYRYRKKMTDVLILLLMPKDVSACVM